MKVLDNISFTLGHDDKVAFVGSNEVAKTVLFKILIGEMEPDEGTYKWGVTTSQAYFPKDFGGEFDSDYNITEWLTQYSEEKDVTYSSRIPRKNALLRRGRCEEAESSFRRRKSTLPSF